MRILFLFLCLIFGCEEKEETILEADALLRWSGDYAVDGCGFFILIDEYEYKSENETIIDDSLKSRGFINVFIEYELLNKTIEYSCGFSGLLEIDGIKLHSIRKIFIP